jgi:3-methyl-2-oxobutanoate hydroxymethyltransferase
MSDGSFRAPTTPDRSHADEVTPPYRSGPPASATGRPKRTRIHHLRELKERGERWPMLTAYDLHRRDLRRGRIPVLLVGDSAANNVYGYANTLPVTVDDGTAGQGRGTRTKNALVVADLPFGSYQIGPEQALTTAFRFMKEGGAHAVKLEGGAGSYRRSRALAGSGIPVMAHLVTCRASTRWAGSGAGPRRRGEHLIEDALAMQSAGAFAVVLEMVPRMSPTRDGRAGDPDDRHRAGPDCDAQVLVWSDMAG